MAQWAGGATNDPDCSDFRGCDTLGFAPEWIGDAPLSKAQDLDLAALTSSIRDLLSKGLKNEAQERSEVLFAYVPADGRALQQVSHVLRDAGLSGPAQAMIERFIELHPEERWPRLMFIESRIRPGLKRDVVQGIIGDYRPNSLDEHLYLATCLARIQMAGYAASIYESAVQKFPQSLHAWKGLIESYNRKSEHRAARAALKKLLPLSPQDAGGDYWAFIAEQASLASDRKVFALAAPKAEALLTTAETDALSRLMLARAYGTLNEKASMLGLLRQYDFNLLCSAWILSEILVFTEVKNLDEFHVPIARRILELPACKYELQTKCERILETHRIHAAARFPWDLPRRQPATR
jgi:tetratricopeptide (TPR) repeat protein